MAGFKLHAKMCQATNIDGMTSSLCCVQGGHVAVVQYLLQARSETSSHASYPIVAECCSGYCATALPTCAGRMCLSIEYALTLICKNCYVVSNVSLTQHPIQARAATSTQSGPNYEGRSRIASTPLLQVRGTFLLPPWYQHIRCVASPPGMLPAHSMGLHKT